MSKKSVKLVSAEGFEFIIDHKAACVSNTIKQMLSSEGNFTETELGEISFPEISSPILEKICEYFYYKLRYQNESSNSIPEFQLPPEIALELLKAANYLDT
ncbi:POZ domain-containing protein [Coccomyxa subellipsoidea C-169]|uniref:Elongin-C n=1 Tax=Coccomyxa subellipsoidea (strain C-169) TaxID=574566 RepID=I0YT50_COCSC|nr:POZ domain-containing protein [Coccomyxa subellipsoidea C-169]EIE21569.1 POZ domain-containing protein [Coccomyxa subellipsoidea C-169]|eukprot:XP_005646113.1 POZ domain-containing protein [Coccomyxa subellipsoidea C-169]